MVGRPIAACSQITPWNRVHCAVFMNRYRPWRKHGEIETTRVGKDNPMASQIYTRRRRALARRISSGDAHKLVTADEALETLMQAAERFVNVY